MFGPQYQEENESSKERFQQTQVVIDGSHRPNALVVVVVVADPGLRRHSQQQMVAVVEGVGVAARPRHPHLSLRLLPLPGRHFRR